WQRERFAALPDVRFKGITFTMPDVLWPFFQDNPELTKSLPTLAAAVIQTFAEGRCGLKVGVIGVLHTFNGRLGFNCHVHTMVTAGGLNSTGAWGKSVFYDQDWLTSHWRSGVIRLLRAATACNLLATNLNKVEVVSLLARQASRWWSVKIQSFDSKE